MTKLASVMCAVFGVFAFTSLAFAQPVEGEGGAEVSVGAEEPTEQPTTTVADAPDQPEMAEEHQTSAPEAIQQASAHTPHEEENKPYYFLGARLRLLWVPSFLVNLFANVEDWGGAIDPGAGLEFTYRKNGFDIVTSLWWQSFSTNGAGYMKGQGDQRTEMEQINSTLNAYYLSADFIWSHQFNDVFAFTYGAGLGVGIVTGSLTRSEAYFQGGKWVRCPRPNPDLGDNPLYCEDGGQYDVDENDSGGDVPPVVPWVALDLGLRIKPHRNFMMRVDLGVGIGFFLGVSGNYGL